MTTYKCPECGGDCIEVVIRAWARIYVDAEDGNVQTDLDDVDDASHEWDGNSPARCQECQHTGKAGDFEVDDTVQPDDPDPDPDIEDGWTCDHCGHVNDNECDVCECGDTRAWAVGS